LIPLVGALLILAASRVSDNLREGVTLTTAIALAINVWSLAPELMSGGRPELQLFEILPGIDFWFSDRTTGHDVCGFGIWSMDC